MTAHTTLQRFVRDRRASAAPIFAAAIIPMFGLIGAAVDYSRAGAAQTAIQAAADSTALAMSKDAQTLAPGDLQTAGQTYFLALLANHPEIQNLNATVTYATTNGSQLVVRGTGSVKTMFLNIWPFNISAINVAGSTTSTWGMTRLRVALVLDNTGSMSDADSSGLTKMAALKTATKNLLTQLKNAAQKDGDVYVSIIPFAKDVNADSSNYQASWIDWTEWDQWSKNCAAGYDSSKSSQRTSAANKCGGAFVTSGTKWVWQVDHSKWNGCVMDRDQNYDTMNTTPTAGANFPAEQYSSCPASLMALTYDWDSLSSKVDAMSPSGSTNQTIGLVWGWQSLLSSAPLTVPPQDPNYQYQQVVILLTDGLNTEDRWYGNGSQVSSQVDARMKKACDNIKAAPDGDPNHVTIYTVQVNINHDPTSTLLQGCASNKQGTTDHFFLLTKSDQIISTFQAIGTNLSQLRIAK